PGASTDHESHSHSSSPRRPSPNPNPNPRPHQVNRRPVSRSVPAASHEVTPPARRRY
uniref:Uncharacterized protein n=1 Tax=Aegilops tauschii subsp. strangulata TaxID=200361 RepID=A0A453GZY8_AEGTS